MHCYRCYEKKCTCKNKLTKNKFNKQFRRARIKTAKKMYKFENRYNGPNKDELQERQDLILYWQKLTLKSKQELLAYLIKLDHIKEY